MPDAKRKRPKPKRKYNLSEEGRKRLSDAAKERGLGGAETGKLGGRGKTKEKRLAGQIIAEAAAEDAEKITQVFRDAIDPNRPLQQRLRGAEAYVKIANEDAKLQQQKAKADAEQMTRDQLLDMLAEKLSSGPTAQIMSAHLGGQPEVIEGNARVVDHGD